MSNGTAACQTAWLRISFPVCNLEFFCETVHGVFVGPEPSRRGKVRLEQRAGHDYFRYAAISERRNSQRDRLHSCSGPRSASRSTREARDDGLLRGCDCLVYHFSSPQLFFSPLQIEQWFPKRRQLLSNVQEQQSEVQTVLSAKW